MIFDYHWLLVLQEAVVPVEDHCLTTIHWQLSHASVRIQKLQCREKTSSKMQGFGSLSYRGCSYIALILFLLICNSFLCLFHVYYWQSWTAMVKYIPPGTLNETLWHNVYDNASSTPADIYFNLFTWGTQVRMARHVWTFLDNIAILWEKIELELLFGFAQNIHRNIFQIYDMFC